MIRQSFLFSFFAFLLLFAQQQAMLHPYEHSAVWLQKSTGSKQALPHSQSCEKCVSLADLGSVILPRAVVHISHAKSERSSKSVQPAFSVFTRSFYLARAPPFSA